MKINIRTEIYDMENKHKVESALHTFFEKINNISEIPNSNKA